MASIILSKAKESLNNINQCYKIGLKHSFRILTLTTSIETIQK